VELADAVGPAGEVVGVERDAQARAAAVQLIAAARAGNARVIHGEATATGLEPGTYDAVMMRHVLIHNGPLATKIVAHLATLLRPGGHLFLLETDPLGWRRDPDNDDVADCCERWLELMRRKGNDLLIGSKLGRLQTEAGLELVERDARYGTTASEDFWRGMGWAARQAIVDAGLATNDDVHRWDAGFRRLFALPGDKILFVPWYRAIGRKKRTLPNKPVQPTRASGPRG
jgi:SAM-dependent methyltransferase